MNQCFFGDCRETMRRLIAEGVKVQTCVTSPPYFGLRDYGHEGQLGQESTPAEFVQNLVEVFRLVRELLTDHGTLWLNLGDSYGANKQLIGIPWRVAFALQDDGWILRQDIIWHKSSAMPESVTDRCTKAHEYIFLLSKSSSYYFNNEAIKTPIKDSSAARLIQDIENQQGSDRVPGKMNVRTKAVRFGGDKQCPDTRWQSGKEWNPRMAGGGSNMPGHKNCLKADGTPFHGLMANKRSVWTVPSTGFKDAHFAVFPAELIEPCILAGARVGDIVLDPFFGSGTTGEVAQKHGRRWIGCELNPAYEAMQRRRTSQQVAEELC